MTDEELVAAFVGGSESAFTLLVRRYKDRVVNFLYRMLGDEEDALDIAQEAFVRLHARAHTYRPVAKFSTWFFTIAANLARSELRRRKWVAPWRVRAGNAGSRPPEPADPGGLPDDRAAEALRAEAVAAALADLPDAFREAVVLHYIEDRSYEEICAMLGIRMGTLKSRLNRARALLASRLGGLLEDDERG